jgi:hypothetical protein
MEGLGRPNVRDGILLRLPAKIDVRATLGLLIVAAWLSCGEDQGSTARTATPSLSLISRHAGLDALEFRALALAWIDESNIAVIDRDDQQVVFLNLTDGTERRMGSEGGGPGELENALVLLGDGSGGVFVGDMKQKRVSQFGPSGAFMRSAPVPGMPIGLASRDGDRVTAIWMQFEMGDPPSFVPTAGVIDLATGDGSALFSLYEPETGLARPESENPFAPPFISVVMDDAGRLIAGQSTEYRIVAFDLSGTVISTFGRGDLDPRYLSDEELAAARQQQASNARGDVPPPGMRRAMEDALDEPRPFFGPGTFALDDAGRLYVITDRMTDDSTEIDVFDSDGSFLGTLMLRDRVRSLAFHGDRAVALVDRVAEDVEGFSGVDLYAIQ